MNYRWVILYICLYVNPLSIQFVAAQSPPFQVELHLPKSHYVYEEEILAWVIISYGVVDEETKLWWDKRKDVQYVLKNVKNQKMVEKWPVNHTIPPGVPQGEDRQSFKEIPKEAAVKPSQGIQRFPTEVDYTRKAVRNYFSGLREGVQPLLVFRLTDMNKYGKLPVGRYQLQAQWIFEGAMVLSNWIEFTVRKQPEWEKKAHDLWEKTLFYSKDKQDRIEAGKELLRLYPTSIYAIHVRSIIIYEATSLKDWGTALQYSEQQWNSSFLQEDRQRVGEERAAVLYNSGRKKECKQFLQTSGLIQSEELLKTLEKEGY